MSKKGHTKSRILSIIASDSRTPSDISAALGLDLSTVSQHLHELEAMGAVEEHLNPHFRKSKTYTRNPEFNYDGLDISPRQANVLQRNTKTLVGSAVIILMIFAAYFLLAGQARPIVTSDSVQVLLTDPPIVPQNTQALYVNYSAVSIHLDHKGTAEWVVSNNSGEINLLSLVNATAMIAQFTVPVNSTIDEVRLNLTSGSILINGTSYNLTLRNGLITSKVLFDHNSNSSSQVLLDISPTVVHMYINGQDAFVMVPQAGSISLNADANPQANDNTTITKLDNDQQNGIKSMASNLSIVNASLISRSGNLNFSITVKNTDLRSFDIRSILILGQQYLVNDSNSTSSPLIPTAVSNRHQAVDFIVANNGTPVFWQGKNLDSSLERINDVYPYATSGYLISPNQTITINYRGALPVSNTSDIYLLNGTSYKVSVLGDLVSHATLNITAT